jgi:hypothetical protein
MLLNVIYLGGSAWLGFAGVAAAVFRCDESCFNTGGNGDWRHDSDAWQWDAAGWLGGASLVLAALVAASAGPRPLFARALLAAQVAAAAFLLGIMDVARWRSIGTFIAVAGVLVTGLALTRFDLIHRLGGRR